MDYKEEIARLVSYTNLHIAQISKDMFYRWWNHYKAEGENGLKEKDRGRPNGYGVEDSLQKRVITLRKRYEW